MASKPEVSPVCLHGPVRLYLVIMTEMSMCSGKRKMLPMQITCRNQTSVLAKNMNHFSDTSLHNELNAEIWLQISAEKYKF